MTQYPLPLLEGQGTGVEPASRRDDWVACRGRVRTILRVPEFLLPWLFGLVFGIADAMIAGNSTGWVVVAVCVALMVVVSGGNNLKFWAILYPVIFVAPRFKLGDWSEEGEKLLGLQLYDPWILLLLCLWIPGLVAAKRLDLPSSMKWALGLLLVLGLWAIRIAPDRAIALKIAGRTFFEPMLLFAVVASLPWKRTELRWGALVLISVAAVVATTSFFGYWTGEGDRTKELLRLKSYWEGTNVLAAFLVAVLPVGLGVVLARSSWLWGLVSGMALVTASAALVSTYTRGAWLAVGLGLGLMVVWLRAWMWTTLVLLVILLIVIAGPPQILTRIESIVRFERDRSASNRLLLWPVVISLVAEKPLTGYGFGGFKVQFRGQSSVIHAAHAHNIFLDYALALGVLAPLLFLWIVGYVWVRALAALRRFRRSEDWPLLLGLWAGSTSMLMAGMTDGSIPIWPILAHTFWFILALTYAVTVAMERDLRPSSPTVGVTAGRL
jgi:O-antigen ligase